MKYWSLCNIALYSIGPCFYHQSYPQLGIVFALAPSLHPFWSYFSTDLQKHIGHQLTWGVPLSVSYHFAFSYCSWGSQVKNTEGVCHSLLQWTAFSQTSPPWPSRLGWPHTACLSFIELDKTVVLVWLDWLVFCDYGFSVSALWCPLARPTIWLGFLLPWTCSPWGHKESGMTEQLTVTLPWAWGISSWLLQQSTAAAPYLGQGVSPYRLRAWPSMWDSSSRPFCACAATTPQVAPPGRWPWPLVWVSPPGCHWPLTRGSSSQLPALSIS